MASRKSPASLSGRASLVSPASRECQDSEDSQDTLDSKDSQDTNSILNLEYRITNERSRTPGHVEIT